MVSQFLGLSLVIKTYEGVAYVCSTWHELYFFSRRNLGSGQRKLRPTGELLQPKACILQQACKPTSHHFKMRLG